MTTVCTASETRSHVRLWKTEDRKMQVPGLRQ